MSIGALIVKNGESKLNQVWSAILSTSILGRLNREEHKLARFE